MSGYLHARVEDVRYSREVFVEVDNIHYYYQFSSISGYVLSTSVMNTNAIA